MSLYFNIKIIFKGIISEFIKFFKSSNLFLKKIPAKEWSEPDNTIIPSGS